MIELIFSKQLRYVNFTFWGWMNHQNKVRWIWEKCMATIGSTQNEANNVFRSWQQDFGLHSIPWWRRTSISSLSSNALEACDQHSTPGFNLNVQRLKPVFKKAGILRSDVLDKAILSKLWNLVNTVKLIFQNAV